jgi:putative transposase
MLYKNKYRVESTRLKHWDYSSKGRYFITICTHHREHMFGAIVNGQMQLNENGNIVHQCWFDLPNHYPHIILDAFVIMPNHIHGIMGIDDCMVETGFKPVSTDVANNNVMGIDDCMVETGFKPVSTDVANNNEIIASPISVKPHGVSEFVRALKTFSSRKMNEMNHTPGLTRWQSRFHDHIIRNERELQRIQQYIHNNPLTWDNDSLKL